MPAEAFALSSAVVFGLVHFFSGLLARRADSASVALYGQCGGVVLVTCAALAWPGTGFSLTATAWGALSGVGTGVGVSCLYRGLATGHMSVVVPVSDVGSVALPVLVGVVVLGDRPSTTAWFGVGAALPALWLVSRTRPATAAGGVAGSRDGLVAGVGFALQFLAISRVDVSSAPLPVLAARLTAIAVIVPLSLQRGASSQLPRRLVIPAGVVGAVGSVARLSPSADSVRGSPSKTRFRSDQRDTIAEDVADHGFRTARTFIEFARTEDQDVAGVAQARMHSLGELSSPIPLPISRDDREIHVAVGPRFATSNRSEQQHTHDLGAGKARDDVLQRRDRIGKRPQRFNSHVILIDRVHVSTANGRRLDQSQR